ncbi:class III extradiol dioxygenase subunit B-like domain-containing protein [Gordonia jinhuaensis]|uniref:Uncharacterized protein n=1 Tax=Gordonia jinhuaensis TaxID=1517702 RepID=A0A916WQX6_9ACTN|nr:hypothetical protein GCM10011489_12780 [Gordonia jinhuaensis]
MNAVLTDVAVVPAAPVLVPELAGAGALEIAAVRAAAVARVRRLAQAAPSWVVVGIDDTHAGPARTGGIGTFRGFGRDVVVTLRSANSDGSSAAPDPEMPLPLLIAGWLRGEVVGPTSVEIDLDASLIGLVDARTAPEECRQIGKELRHRIDATPGPVGVLLVADGSIRLTDKAPGGPVAGAREFQDTVDDALTRGDLSAITSMTTAQADRFGYGGRAAFQVVTGLLGDQPQLSVEVDYRDAPLGVGYLVGRLAPTPAPAGGAPEAGKAGR